jgi:hypothetical protein
MTKEYAFMSQRAFDTGYVSIKGDVFVLRLLKRDRFSNEDKHTGRAGYGVFGYHDYAEFSQTKAESFKDLDIHEMVRNEKSDDFQFGAALWHSISLFSLHDEVKLDSIKKALKSKITLVSLLKLDPFEIAAGKEEHGGQFFKKLTKKVKESIKKEYRNIVKNGTEPKIFVFVSLSSFDVVTFVASEYPRKSKISVKIFSTKLKVQNSISTTFQATRILFAL